MTDESASSLPGCCRCCISFADKSGLDEYVYPNQQRGATLWYHDHRMDFTGAQVWRGLAGFYLIRDEDEAQLRLPRGEKEARCVIVPALRNPQTSRFSTAHA